MARTTTKPHADEAGFITAKVNMLSGQDIVLYDGEVAGFDLADGRWVVVCHAHGSTEHETNQRRARKHMATPEAWCSGCRQSKRTEPTRTMRLVPFGMKTPAEQAREMRFAARRIQGNPEKIALFERIYGEKPDAYYEEEARAPSGPTL